MNSKTPFFLVWTVCLVLGVILVITDLASDATAGANQNHIAAELLILLTLIGGLIAIITDQMRLRSRLKSLTTRLDEANREAALWKTNHHALIEGVSKAIDHQLEAWKLTESEKEVALLLMKGLSHKEIAEVRGSTEKTTRAQGAAIYQKSGLSGRAELAAFFLEDLLTPLRNTS